MTTTAKLQEIEWLGDGSAYFRPPVMAHDAGYLMGAAEANYPVPCKMGTIYREKNLLQIDSADEGFDPEFTWDCVNGRWPSDSPNNR